MHEGRGLTLREPVGRSQVAVAEAARLVWLCRACRCPFNKSQILPVRNVTVRKVEMTLGQLSSSVEAAAFPSRPDDSSDAARSGGDGRSGATRSAPNSARAWRGRQTPDLPRSEHRGRLGSGRGNRRRVWLVRVHRHSKRTKYMCLRRTYPDYRPRRSDAALPGHVAGFPAGGVTHRLVKPDRAGRGYSEGRRPNTGRRGVLTR